jgi:hypothetical protein
MSERTVRRAALLRLLAVVAGLGLVWFVTAGATPASGGLLLGAAGVALATAVVAAAAVSAASARVAVALVVALSGSASRRPAERIDLPAAITQARPDAAGRPRPRAPGVALQAV